MRRILFAALIVTLAGLRGHVLLAQHSEPEWNTDTTFDTVTATKPSFRTGNWSDTDGDTSPWCVAPGGTCTLPGANDVVLINGGFTVTVDTTAEAMIIRIAAGGTLTHRINGDSDLRFGTMIIVHDPDMLPGGTTGGVYNLGTPAAPIGAGYTAYATIRNITVSESNRNYGSLGLDVAIDNHQHGTGILNGGFMACGGQAKTSWVRMVNNADVGATSISIIAPTGWLTNDQVAIPATAHEVDTTVPVDATAGGGLWAKDYWPKSEVRTLNAPAVGSMAFTAPLAHEHHGSLEYSSGNRYKPAVGNLTRNAVIRSENGAPTATRGHVMHDGHASFNVQNCELRDLGRTGFRNLSHTTNHIGRYPWHLHHLMAPAAGTITPAGQPGGATQAYRTVFINNSVHGRGCGTLTDNDNQFDPLYANRDDDLAVNLLRSDVGSPNVVFTSDAPHGLTSGEIVRITAHTTTPSVLGADYVITKTGESTFTIPVAVTVADTDGSGVATRGANNETFVPGGIGVDPEVYMNGGTGTLQNARYCTNVEVGGVGVAVDQRDDVKWAIAIHRSHWGYWEGNVTWRYGGAHYMTEDGSESHHMLYRNWGAFSNGFGGHPIYDRRAFAIPELAQEGSIFWMRSQNNTLLDNVGANAARFVYVLANIDVEGQPSTTGLNDRLGYAEVPTAPEDDDVVSVNMKATFGVNKGNECFGQGRGPSNMKPFDTVNLAQGDAIEGCIEAWEILGHLKRGNRGTNASDPSFLRWVDELIEPVAAEGVYAVIEDFKAWNVWSGVLNVRNSAQLEFKNITAVGLTRPGNDLWETNVGVDFAHQEKGCFNCKMTGGTVVGFFTGVYLPTIAGHFSDAEGTFTMTNVTGSNRVEILRENQRSDDFAFDMIPPRRVTITDYVQSSLHIVGDFTRLAFIRNNYDSEGNNEIKVIRTGITDILDVTEAGATYRVYYDQQDGDEITGFDAVPTPDVTGLPVAASSGGRNFADGNGMLVAGQTNTTNWAACGAGTGYEVDNALGYPVGYGGTGTTASGSPRFYTQGSKAIGTTVITIQEGTVPLPVGATIKWLDHDTIYRVTASSGSPYVTSMTITPALTDSVTATIEFFQVIKLKTGTGPAGNVVTFQGDSRTYRVMPAAVLDSLTGGATYVTLALAGLGLSDALVDGDDVTFPCNADGIGWHVFVGEITPVDALAGSGKAITGGSYKFLAAEGVGGRLHQYPRRIIR